MPDGEGPSARGPEQELLARVGDHAHVSTEDRDRLRESLPPLPESVAKARLLVRSAMRDAGWHEDLVEDAQLAVSELVTNAVVHAGTLIGVSVSVGLDLVRVGVTDGSPNLPRTRDYASTAGTGRGLHLLAGLVTAWGVASHPEQAEEGKTVWFELGQDRAAAARAGERGWGLLEDFAVEDLLGPVETRRADAVLCGTYVEYGGPATEQPETPVDLLDPPVVLYQAWRQHADALLREHFLATVNQSATYDAVRVHAEASDALALLDAAIPHRARARTAEEALAGAAEASTEPKPNITMTVPHQSISHPSIGLQSTSTSSSRPTQ